VEKDSAAPSGYSVSFDQSAINSDNETAAGFTFAGAEVDATYNYSIDDTNVDTTAITGSGTISTATDQITGINLSTLDDDTLTLTVYLTDPAGNQGSDTTDTVEKDSAGPTFTSVAVTDSDEYYKAGDTISLDVDLAETGLTVSADLSVLDSAFSSSQALADDGDNTYSYTTIALDETTMIEGIDTALTVTAADTAGNSASDSSLTLTIDKTAPAITDITAASVDKAGDTIAVTFNESMDTGTLTDANLAANIYSIQYSDDAGNTNEVGITITNAVVAWSGGGTVATVTLDEATDTAYIPDGKYIGVTPGSGAVKDLAGNAVAASENYSLAVSKETAAPAITVTAEAVQAGDDTVTITSDEVLASAAETLTNWTVYYDDDNTAGGETEIATANASISSLDATKTEVTITLNAVDDGAYIPDGKYVKVVPDSTNITDLAGNAGVAAAWTDSPVSGDTTAPTFTVAAESIHGGGDTITLTFNEVMDTGTLTDANLAANLELDYSDDASDIGQQDITLTNAAVSWGSDKKVATVTLDEETDAAYIPDGKYIGVSPGTDKVKDLAGNAAATTEIYTSSAITAEATPPGFTDTAPAASASVNDTNVSYTLSETCESATITWTQTGGTADGNSPHQQSLTGDELDKGAHSDITLTNSPALQDGAIYTVSFAGTDLAGNASPAVENTNVTYDVTGPSIDSVSLASNNANDTTLAKEGDAVTFSIAYSEAVTASVTTGSTANNVSTLTSDLSAGDSASDTIVFTVASGDNGEVTPNNIDFTIADAAGNSTDITTLGTITGEVRADTTLPTATIGVNPDPTSIQDAGGLTITIVFSETMNTSVNPVVSYDPAGSTPAQPCTGGTWSTTTNTDDTYTVTNDNAIMADTGDGEAAISVTTAEDLAGNVMDDDTDDTFTITTTELEVSGIADPITAGDSSDVTVTIKDADGNIRTDYTGTITFTATDSSATIPADYTFTAGDDGEHTFTDGVTFKTSGDQTVTATDTESSAITGSQTVTVKSAETSSYTLNSPDDIVAGERAAYTVTRYDSYGNEQTVGSETVYLTTTSSPGSFKNAASGGSTITSVSFSGGQSSAGFWYYDTLVGDWTITASNSTATITDTDALSVNHAATDRFKVTAGVETVKAGYSTEITITAYDQFYNVATSYEGSNKRIEFSGASDSPDGTSPTSTNNVGNDIDFGAETILTFTDGVAASTMYLYKAEGAVITAEDLDDTSITTSSSDDLDILCQGGDAVQLSWESQPEAKAVAHAPWKSFALKVTDDYGNQASTNPDVTVTPTGATVTDDSTATVTARSGLATFDDFAVYNSSDDTAGGYPINVTVNAAATGLTESGASGEVIISKDYDVEVKVLDSVTGNALTDVTLQILDADSGEVYEYTGLTNPVTANSPFSFYLPYDTFNFNIEKEAYVENTLEKTANVSADYLDGSYDNNISWTLYMTSIAESLADYRVLSDFVYDQENDKLYISVRLEKRGRQVVSEDPNYLQTCALNIYDSSDMDTAKYTDSLSSPDDEGTYWFTVSDAVDSEGFVSGQSYFVKMSILYGAGETGDSDDSLNVTYTAVNTFNIGVTAQLAEWTEEIKTEVAGVKTEVTSQAETTRSKVSEEAAATRTKVAAEAAKTQTKVDTGVATIKSGISASETAVKSEVERKASSRILNTANYIKSGDTLTVRYKADPGLSPTIDVYDADNTKQVDEEEMAETIAGESGVYEYDVEFDWGKGEHTIVCKETSKGTLDGINIQVISTDLEQIGSTTTTTMGQVSSIDVQSLSNLGETLESVGGIITNAMANIDELSAVSDKLKNFAASASKTIYEQLANASEQLETINAETGIKINQMLELSEVQSDNVGYVKNKTIEIQKAIEIQKDILEREGDKPITKSWLESGGQQRDQEQEEPPAENQQPEQPEQQPEQQQQGQEQE
jgi:hypothetical protein